MALSMPGQQHSTSSSVKAYTASLGTMWLGILISAMTPNISAGPWPCESDICPVMHSEQLFA